MTDMSAIERLRKLVSDPDLIEMAVWVPPHVRTGDDGKLIYVDGYWRKGDPAPTYEELQEGVTHVGPFPVPEPPKLIAPLSPNLDNYSGATALRQTLEYGQKMPHDRPGLLYEGQEGYPGPEYDAMSGDYGINRGIFAIVFEAIGNNDDSWYGFPYGWKTRDKGGVVRSMYKGPRKAGKYSSGPATGDSVQMTRAMADPEFIAYLDAAIAQLDTTKKGPLFGLAKADKARVGKQRNFLKFVREMADVQRRLFAGQLTVEEAEEHLKKWSDAIFHGTDWEADKRVGQKFGSSTRGLFQVELVWKTHQRAVSRYLFSMKSVDLPIDVNNATPEETRSFLKSLDDLETKFPDINLPNVIDSMSDEQLHDALFAYVAHPDQFEKATEATDALRVLILKQSQKLWTDTLATDAEMLQPLVPKVVTGGKKPPKQTPKQTPEGPWSHVSGIGLVYSEGEPFPESLKEYIPLIPSGTKYLVYHSIPEDPRVALLTPDGKRFLITKSGATEIGDNSPTPSPEAFDSPVGSDVNIGYGGSWFEVEGVGVFDEVADLSPSDLDGAVIAPNGAVIQLNPGENAYMEPGGLFITKPSGWGQWFPTDGSSPTAIQGSTVAGNITTPPIATGGSVQKVVMAPPEWSTTTPITIGEGDVAGYMTVGGEPVVVVYSSQKYKSPTGVVTDPGKKPVILIHYSNGSVVWGDDSFGNEFVKAMAEGYQGPLTIAEIDEVPTTSPVADEQLPAVIAKNADAGSSPENPFIWADLQKPTWEADVISKGWVRTYTPGPRGHELWVSPDGNWYEAATDADPEIPQGEDLDVSIPTKWVLYGDETEAVTHVFNGSGTGPPIGTLGYSPKYGHWSYKIQGEEPQKLTTAQVVLILQQTLSEKGPHWVPANPAKSHFKKDTVPQPAAWTESAKAVAPSIPASVVFDPDTEPGDLHSYLQEQVAEGNLTPDEADQVWDTATIPKPAPNPFIPKDLIAVAEASGMKAWYRKQDPDDPDTAMVLAWMPAGHYRLYKEQPKDGLIEQGPWTYVSVHDAALMVQEDDGWEPGPLTNVVSLDSAANSAANAAMLLDKKYPDNLPKPPTKTEQNEINGHLRERGALYISKMNYKEKKQWLKLYAAGNNLALYALEAYAAGKTKEHKTKTSKPWQHKNKLTHPGSPESPLGKLSYQAFRDFLETRPWGEVYLSDAAVSTWTDWDLRDFVFDLNLNRGWDGYDNGTREDWDDPADISPADREAFIKMAQGFVDYVPALVVKANTTGPGGAVAIPQVDPKFEEGTSPWIEGVPAYFQEYAQNNGLKTAGQIMHQLVLQSGHSEQEFQQVYFSVSEMDSSDIEVSQIIEDVMTSTPDVDEVGWNDLIDTWQTEIEQGITPDFDSAPTDEPVATQPLQPTTASWTHLTTNPVTVEKPYSIPQEVWDWVENFEHLPPTTPIPNEFIMGVPEAQLRQVVKAYYTKNTQRHAAIDAMPLSMVRLLAWAGARNFKEVGLQQEAVDAQAAGKYPTLLIHPRNAVKLSIESRIDAGVYNHFLVGQYGAVDLPDGSVYVVMPGDQVRQNGQFIIIRHADKSYDVWGPQGPALMLDVAGDPDTAWNQASLLFAKEPVPIPPIPVGWHVYLSYGNDPATVEDWDNIVAIIENPETEATWLSSLEMFNLNSQDEIDNWIGQQPEVDPRFLENAPPKIRAYMAWLLKTKEAQGGNSAGAVDNRINILNFRARMGAYGIEKPALTIDQNKPYAQYVIGGKISPSDIPEWSMSAIDALISDFGVPYEADYYGSSSVKYDAVAEFFGAVSKTEAPTKPGITQKPSGPITPGVLAFEDLQLVPDKEQIKKIGSYAGSHRKGWFRDQFGNGYMAKPYASDHTSSKMRVDAEVAAAQIAILFGFDHPTVYRADIDLSNPTLGFTPGELTAPDIKGTSLKSVHCYVQILKNRHKGTPDFTYIGDIAALNDTMLIELGANQALDWLISNSDTNDGNIMITEDGLHVFPIDKGQAWKYFPSDKLAVGYQPGNNAGKQVYDRLWKAIINHQIGKERADILVQGILAESVRISETHDEQVRKYLEEAFENRPSHSFPNGWSKEQMIDAVMARKKAVGADMYALIQSVYEQANYEWSIPPLEEIGPKHVTLPDGRKLHVAVSAELVADVQKAQIHGVPFFTSAEDIEDGHVILHQQNDKDGNPKLMGEMHLGHQADLDLVKWIKDNEVVDTGGGTVPVPVGAVPLPKAASWYSVILTAAKTVNFHATDGEYNADAIGALAPTKAEIEDNIAKVKAWNAEHGPSEYLLAPLAVQGAGLKFESREHQDAWLAMAEQYLAHIEIVQKAYEAKTKTYVDPSNKILPEYTYTPKPKPKVVKEYASHQDQHVKIVQTEAGWEQQNETDQGVITVELTSEEAAKLLASGDYSEASALGKKKDWKLHKRDNYRALGDFNWEDGTLTETGAVVTEVGNLSLSGTQFDIEIGKDIRISYSPRKGNGLETAASIAQQGLLRFEIRNFTGDLSEIAEVIAALREMGLNLDPATLESIELFYWRYVWSVFNNRDVAAIKNQQQFKDFVNVALQKHMTPDEEIAMWRQAWEILLGSKEKVDEIDVYPELLHPRVQEPTLAAGHPQYQNPIFEPVSALSPVWHSRTYGASNKPWATPERIAKSGGLNATEERIRVYSPIQLGTGVGGGSSHGDAVTHGSSQYLFLWNTSHTGGIVLAPHVRRRLSNFGTEGDAWGNINKAKYSPFKAGDPGKKWAHRSESQYVTKWGVSLLDDLVYFDCESQQARQKIIDFFKAQGIYEIRGVSIEKRFGVGHPSTAQIEALIKQAQEAGYED